jgi:hypothetical protein
MSKRHQTNRVANESKTKRPKPNEGSKPIVSLLRLGRNDVIRSGVDGKDVLRNAYGIVTLPGEDIQYICGTTMYTRRKIMSMSICTPYEYKNYKTYAGDQRGYVDGPLDKALFERPTDIVMDYSRRMLYIADSGNDCIRTIDIDRKLVGTLDIGDIIVYPTGLALDPTNNTLYVGECGDDSCVRVIDLDTNKYSFIDCVIGTHKFISLALDLVNKVLYANVMDAIHVIDITWSPVHTTFLCQRFARVVFGRMTFDPTQNVLYSISECGHIIEKVSNLSGLNLTEMIDQYRRALDQHFCGTLSDIVLDYLYPYPEIKLIRRSY